MAPACTECTGELELVTTIPREGDRPEVFVFRCTSCTAIDMYVREKAALRKWPPPGIPRAAPEQQPAQQQQQIQPKKEE
jgi:hypothetical protein